MNEIMDLFRASPSIYPLLMKPYKRIFLLSHMRANTSLFGHILGNSPEIEGYYEMHIGYYSWKSLYRQKLLHFSSHKPKPKAKYLFDKILHDDHYIHPDILHRSDTQTIFSLREPDQTIRSIVMLYEKVDPDHEFHTVDGAIGYYNERLSTLLKIAKELDGKFLYIDAQSLRDDTNNALHFLTQKLELITPLSNEYQCNKLTGIGNAGDHSKNIKIGKIVPGKTDYSEIILDSKQIAESVLLYKKVRDEMITSSSAFLEYDSQRK